MATRMRNTTFSHAGRLYRVWDEGAGDVSIERWGRPKGTMGSVWEGWIGVPLPTRKLLDAARAAIKSVRGT